MWHACSARMAWLFSDIFVMLSFAFVPVPFFFGQVPQMTIESWFFLLIVGFGVLRL